MWNQYFHICCISHTSLNVQDDELTWRKIGTKRRAYNYDIYTKCLRSMASTICPDHDVGEAIQTVVVTPAPQPEMLYDFVEFEKNKWINQLVAKFRILYASLVDFQSNQLPSVLMTLDSGLTLDQQSTANQIHVSS